MAIRTVVVALAVSGCAAACYSWSCSSLPKGTCYRKDDGHLSIEVQACDDGQKCSIDQTSSLYPYDFSKLSFQCVPEDWLPSKKFPGEMCTSGTECISNSCISGFCVGAGLIQPCTIHADCDVGLVCRSAVCVLQVPAGSRCSHDDDCTNDSLCYNGVCAEVFSLPDGSQFRGTISQFASYLCSSGYFSNDQCSPAPKNLKSPDHICSGPRDCPIQAPDGEVTNGVCYCGFNSNGFSYCAAMPGDDEFQQFQTLLRSVLSIVNQCHFETSLSSRCPALAVLPHYHNFMNAYYVYYYRYGIIGVDNCVSEIMPFSVDYEYAGGGGGNREKTVVIVVVVVVFTAIVAAGVVCCLCVRKCAMDERNHEITRQRLHREEMEEIPVRTGRVVHSPANLQAPAAVFQAESILLDLRNKRFLAVGIPLARKANITTFETEESDDEYDHYVGNTVVIPRFSETIDVKADEGKERPSGVNSRVSSTS